MTSFEHMLMEELASLRKDLHESLQGWREDFARIEQTLQPIPEGDPERAIFEIESDTLSMCIDDVNTILNKDWNRKNGNDN